MISIIWFTDIIIRFRYITNSVLDINTSAVFFMSFVVLLISVIWNIDISKSNQWYQYFHYVVSGIRLNVIIYSNYWYKKFELITSEIRIKLCYIWLAWNCHLTPRNAKIHGGQNIYFSFSVPQISLILFADIMNSNNWCQYGAPKLHFPGCIYNINHLEKWIFFLLLVQFLTCINGFWYLLDNSN